MKIIVEDCSDASYRLRNFGTGILQSHLKSEFIAFEQYLLKPKFKDCRLAFDTLNLENQTIELRYEGALPIQKFFDNLKLWHETRQLSNWSINLVD